MGVAAAAIHPRKLDSPAAGIGLLDRPARTQLRATLEHIGIREKPDWPVLALEQVTTLMGE
jgi:hypothetical protein